MSASERFQLELEFVQALANVDYLAHLAHSGSLDDQDLIHFLTYLQYWQRPEYAKYIVYPQCLRMLELLQDSGFRTALKNPIFVDYARRQTSLHWLFRGTAFLSTPGAPAAAPVADGPAVEDAPEYVGGKRPRRDAIAAPPSVKGDDEQ
mmetsp:Transcript_1368/g.3547  ORF Transcript_1368/g.3547 Transcript_1368/m.3547 type:complete len:149 (-) Transcript_1368:88-534(-)